MSCSEYYCCCLRYPPFPSLPLTERGCSHGWATSTFVGFYCCGEEAIAIERALVDFARDRQVRARATDGERKSGRTRNNLRIKEGLPRWLPSFLSSPHPACLPASALCLFPRLPVSCPVFLTWSVAQACAGLPGLGSLSSHSRRAVFLSCLLVGRWRVSWSSPQGWGGTFFPQICTWRSAFSLH